MKKTNTHFTQEKKKYSQPVLKKIGMVSELTKGIKGSAVDDEGDLKDEPVGP